MIHDFEKLIEEYTRLWKEAFGDSEEFISAFMERYCNKECALHIEGNGKVLSMLHLIPFTLNGYRVAYIYAVATDSCARGKGHASRLIEQAIEKAKENGYKAIITLPADNGLTEFYSRFGFKGRFAVRFKTPDNFDFGTGDTKKDFACILLLDNSLEDLFKEKGTIVLEK